MDHDQATEIQAPLRYAAGDLSPAERDEFEAHFCDCTSCMDEVSVAATFAANARAVFRDRAQQPEGKPQRSWMDLFRLPVPVFAFSGALNLVLVAGLGYQIVRVVPELRARVDLLSSPDAALAVRVTGPTRAASSAIAVPAGARFVRLSFDLPHRFPQYGYILEGTGLAQPRTGSIRGDAEADSIDLMVPVAGLAPGEYLVKLTGPDGAEITRCALRTGEK